MLDIALIRNKPDWLKEQFQKLQDEGAAGRIDEIVTLDEKRRALLAESESLQAERNKLNKKMGGLRGNKKLDDALKSALMRQAAQAVANGDYGAAESLMNGNGEGDGGDDDVNAAMQTLIAALKDLSNRYDAYQEEIREVEANLDEHMYWLPNVPHDSVPVGATDEDNVPHEPIGTIPSFDFEPQPHWDLGPALGMIDFERGVKLHGTRGYVLVGMGARLQRALLSFFLDRARDNGFTEFYVPYLVREEMLYGSAQLPKFRDTVYSDPDAEFFLIPTSEVTLTNLHRDEILDESDLPLHYCAHTPCFRNEKTSAGRDVRGIKRVHQFEKVEMYKFTHPDTSYDELESLTEAAESLCAALGLPYRRLEICTGDLGFSASKKYDVEVWAPGSEEWLEVSSCSNTEAFQARRANIRFRPEGGKKNEFVHTLNGSGLATPRIIIAILENYQQSDGSVIVPDVLRPYLGGLERFEAS